MKQEKKRTTLYLTSEADRWITEQAAKQGISKNDVIQILINEAMKKSIDKKEVDHEN